MEKYPICERLIEDFDEICPYCKNSEDLIVEGKKEKSMLSQDGLSDFSN